MKTALYGEWESLITPELVCQASNSPWETKIHEDAFYWTEQRPSEGGRTVIIRWSEEEGRTVITPIGYSVRTRMYVYGGSAYAVGDTALYFVNDKDQCIYSQGHKGGDPKKITQTGLKYAELCPIKGGLVALVESPGEKHFIGFVETMTGNTIPLVEGADFYSSPQVSPDGKKIAWIEWNHPNMSWDESSLWVGELEGQHIVNRIKIAGGKNESVTQPVWNGSQKLGFVSDKTGWWNLYEWDGENCTPLCPIDAEFGAPQWRFNTTWGYYKGTPIAAYRTMEGWKLGKVEQGQVVSIPLSFNSYSQIKINDDKALLMGGSPLKPFAVYSMNPLTCQVKLISEECCKIPPEWISIPRQISFPTNAEQTKRAYGFFYPPTNPQYSAEGAPPVIVKIHGGPTGAAEASLRSAIQFWTSRGFALFDIDYTGSTGYGRAYRDALKGQWGIADRDDILWGVRYLVEQHWVDKERLYISGSSAGGFTLLRALTGDQLFAKGVCYYAVSDLEALAKDTHKFEKHYLDLLIAPYPEYREEYIQRSPIKEIDKIKASMLIFQGLEDLVVPPAQSRMLFEELKKKGIASELVEYEGEGNGFRQEKTLLDTLKRELKFLQQK